MSTPTYMPGDSVNGHTLAADGNWYPAPAPAPQKSGPSMGVRIAAGIAAALLVTVGGAAIANSMSGDKADAGTSNAHITTSADMSGISANEEEFILDVEAIFGYDAGASEEEMLLWTGQMIVDANDMGGSDEFNEGFVEGFVQEGGTEAQANAFIEAAETNL